MLKMMQGMAGIKDPAVPRPPAPSIGRDWESFANRFEEDQTAIAKLAERFAAYQPKEATWEKALNSPLGQQASAAVGQLMFTIPDYFMRGMLMDKQLALFKEMNAGKISQEQANLAMQQAQQQMSNNPLAQMAGVPQPVPGQPPAPQLFPNPAMMHTHAPPQVPAAPDAGQPAVELRMAPDEKAQLGQLQQQIADLARSLATQNQAFTAMVAQMQLQIQGVRPAASKPTIVAEPLPAPVDPNQRPFVFTCLTCSLPASVVASTRKEAVGRFFESHYSTSHPNEARLFLAYIQDSANKFSRGQWSQEQLAEEIDILENRLAILPGEPAPPITKRPTPPAKPAEPEPVDDEDDDEGESPESGPLASPAQATPQPPAPSAKPEPAKPKRKYHRKSKKAKTSKQPKTAEVSEPAADKE